MNLSKIPKLLSSRTWKVAVLLLLLMVLPVFTTVAHAGGLTEEWAGAAGHDYSLDFSYEGSGVFAAIQEALMMVVFGFTSICWQLSYWLSSFVAYLVGEAYTLDFLNAFSGSIATYVQSIAGVNESGVATSGIFYGFLALVVAILGAYVVYQGLAKRATSQALGTLLNAVLIFLLGVSFIAIAPALLGNVTEFSAEVNESVLSVGMSLINGGVEAGAVDSLKSSVWEILVKNPWKLLQFGTTSVSNEAAEAILQTRGGSLGRTVEILTQMGGIPDMMKDTELFNRFGMSFLILVVNVVTSFFIVMFVVTAVMHELLFLLYIAVAPFVLIFSMLPGSGSNLTKYVLRLVNTLLAKTLIFAIMTLAFFFSTLIYGMTAGRSFLFIAFLQITVFFAAYYNTPTILSLVGIASPMGFRAAEKMQRSVQQTARRVSRGTNRLVHTGTHAAKHIVSRVDSGLSRNAAASGSTGSTKAPDMKGGHQQSQEKNTRSGKPDQAGASRPVGRDRSKRMRESKASVPAAPPKANNSKPRADGGASGNTRPQSATQGQQAGAAGTPPSRGNTQGRPETRKDAGARRSSGSGTTTHATSPRRGDNTRPRRGDNP